MQPTLKDVAKRADVSFTLVSKYLTNNPQARMSPETRERIDRAIAELGYRPSAAARSLRRGRTRMLGLVVASLTNAYYAHFADAALREAKEAGYQLLISLCGNASEETDGALQNLLDRQVDGIICNTHFNPSCAFRCVCPLLVVSDQEREGASSVNVDIRQPLAEAAAHLAARGCRSVRGLFFDNTIWPAAFEAACRECGSGYTAERIPLDEATRREALRRVCREAPGAVFASGWQTAVMLLELLAREFPGYHPELVLHCNFAGPFLADPHISGVIRSSSRQLVREAVACLAEHVEKPELPAAHLRIPAVFIPRDRFAAELPVPDHLSLT
ncbi:MAG: LacI family DNA-binding transcriptional regulator [Lentisphaeria bacterium]|nr:LacI family DNA-binding transcriptional regulator [Lentisphaeria bacterium]